DLRYQHAYHPVPVEQKSPALASVLDDVSAGRFGDGNIYEPLLNTIRQSDYYLITEDFDSCTCHALVWEMDIALIFGSRHRLPEYGRRGVQGQGFMGQEVDHHRRQHGQVQL
ncbi:Non-essential glycogen phosphorylase, partial [Ceratobasidium sp. 428]